MFLMHYFAVKVVADSKFMASCCCCCLALCGGVWYVTLSLETSYLTLQSAVRKAYVPPHITTSWVLSFSPMTFLNLLMNSLPYGQFFVFSVHIFLPSGSGALL